MTTREMCRIECGDMVKVVQKLESSRVQIEGVRCDTAKSAEIHDTCIRPRECVCGSTLNDGRTRAHVSSSVQCSSQSSSQRVGALSTIPSCLGIGGHPTGSRQGHPRYTAARSAERPWVARTRVQHSMQCRYIPNIEYCWCCLISLLWSYGDLLFLESLFLQTPRTFTQ